MQHIAPLGGVYRAGTLSGNPIAMIAGFTMLSEFKIILLYTKNSKKNHLPERWAETKFSKHGDNRTSLTSLSMISVHFSNRPVTDFASAAADNELFKNIFAMLETWCIPSALCV